jgi:DNA-binding Lrp family transcriptional regulator
MGFAVISCFLKALTPTLILFLVLLSVLSPVAEARHSPDLQSKSQELLEAPKVLSEWLSRVGREDLKALLEEAISTNNQTLMKLVVTRVYEYLASDNPVAFFVGGKHVMALKILNKSDDLTVNNDDLGWLLYHATRSLNMTDYSTLSNVLLVILSGFVSYGDHNELSYFMIYLMREPKVRVVSEDLRNELRLQILKFLDYVEAGDFKKAADFGVNVSYTTSMLIGSCMYLIASSYAKYASLSKLLGGSGNVLGNSTIISEVLETLLRANVSGPLIEIIKRLPPEDLNRLLNDLNRLEEVDEEVLVEEINKYVRERRYNMSITSPEPRTSSLVVRVFTAVSSEKGSEITYRFSSELSSLMYLISSKPAFLSSSGFPEPSQGVSPPPARGVMLGSYAPLLLVIFASSAASIILLLKFSSVSRRDLVSRVPHVKQAPPTEAVTSYVVRAFWSVVESLCRFFEVSLGKHETHREIAVKLLPKIKVLAGEELTKLFNDLTKYYELVRFGNLSEDEVMVSVAKRVEEHVLKWGQGS